MLPVVQVQIGNALSRVLAALALLALALWFAPSLLFALICPERTVTVLNGFVSLTREVLSATPAKADAKEAGSTVSCTR